jgi:prevent-host-death family protein
VIQPNDIQTLTEFRRNSGALVERITLGGRPHAITVDGSPTFVVQGADAYQNLIEELEARRSRPSRRGRNAEERR